MIIKDGRRVARVLKGGREVKTIIRGGRVVFSAEGLPYGFTECEYLEGTGTQWIDTGILPKEVDEIRTRFANTNTEPANLLYFGATDGYVSMYVGSTNYSNRKMYFEYGRKSKMYATTDYSDSANDYVVKRRRYTGNGGVLTFYENVSSFDFDTEFADFANTIYVFNVNTKTGVPATIRMEHFTLMKDNAQVMHLIPALDATGTPCMYDTIGMRALYNQGTGQFLYKTKGAPMSVSSPVANALGELSINLTEGADAEITADGELTIDSENDYSINQDGQLTVTY